MNRYKALIEYDGSKFNGWQKQAGQRTVQGALLSALEYALPKDKVDVQGAGRTDAGVHAVGQVAHLDCDSVIDPQILHYKMNDNLPAAVNILSIKRVSREFHARHSAQQRIYVYQISKRRTAFGKNYTWWIKDKLNVQAITNAAAYYVGFHDYKSFANAADVKEEKSTKVQVDFVEVKEVGDYILVRIAASHFLWKMVRRMIAVLVEVGRGNMRPDIITTFLTSYEKGVSQFTAPPSGLFLEQVLYPGDTRKEELKPFLMIGE